MEKINTSALKYILVGIIFFILGGLFLPKASIKPSTSPSPKVENAEATISSTPALNELVKVRRVIDGDTIEIEGGKRVRLIGIDTPELNKSGETGCFGREAFDYAAKLLNGQTVKMEKDISETDRYNRLLRYIYLGDTMINDKLVRDGYAKVYTYPPDVKYKDKFLESEKYARDNNLGLWSKCNDTVNYIAVSPTPGSGNYICDCSKPCTAISSCSEAQYQLKNCGCTKRDADGDGIACDGAPLNCQN